VTGGKRAEIASSGDGGRTRGGCKVGEDQLRIRLRAREMGGCGLLCFIARTGYCSGSVGVKNLAVTPAKGV